MTKRYTGVNGLDDGSTEAPAPCAEDGGETRELAAVAGVVRAVREARDGMRGARDQMANGVRVLQGVGERVDASADRLEALEKAMEVAVHDLRAACRETPQRCARAIREEVRVSLSEPAEAARAAWELAEAAEREADGTMLEAISRLDEASKGAVKRIMDDVEVACANVHACSLARYGVLAACAIAAIACLWLAVSTYAPFSEYKTGTNLDEANLTIALQNAELEAYRSSGVTLSDEKSAELEQQLEEIQRTYDES